MSLEALCQAAKSELQNISAISTQQSSSTTGSGPRIIKLITVKPESAKIASPNLNLTPGKMNFLSSFARLQL